MIYLCNSFSVHMLNQMNCGEWEDVRFRRISSQDACNILKGKKFRSYFGHVDTVKWLESMWRMHIHVSRGMIDFKQGDVMIIATVSSKRQWEQDDYDNSGKGFKFYLVEYV